MLKTKQNKTEKIFLLNHGNYRDPQDVPPAQGTGHPHPSLQPTVPPLVSAIILLAFFCLSLKGYAVICILELQDTDS